jgi:hypothetical protein
MSRSLPFPDLVIMKPIFVLSPFLLLAPVFAQTVSVFPDEYVAVAEGPLNSPNLPLAYGTGRVLCLYEAVDISVPSGQSITRVGFRQDATLTTLDLGRTISLEIRMGYTTQTSANMLTNLDNNYAVPPTTVLPTTNIVLPNLRDTANPLANGQFFINLATPFPYVPAGRNLLIEYRLNGNSGGGGPFNYRIDRADYYSPATYGPAGCPHSGGGTPTITVAPVRPGLNYTCTMTMGPGSSPGILLIQLAQTLVPPYSLAGVIPGIQASCTGQISPVGAVSLAALSSGIGGANWSFLIPNNPAFADLNISSQAVFLDAFAPGGLVTSRGATILTGARPRCTIAAGTGAPASVVTGALNTNYCPVAFFEHQ